MPRLFTGLEVPREVGEVLSMFRGGLPGARWIDPENYHITLRFIGDIDDRLAQDIASLLDGVRKRPFDVRFEELASFGGYKPRAVIAAVDPVSPLVELQAEHERLMWRTISPRGPRCSARRFACRALCCSRRALRSVAAPMWSRRITRSPREVTYRFRP